MSQGSSDETRLTRQHRLSRLFDLHRQILDDAAPDGHRKTQREAAPSPDFTEQFLQQAQHSLMAKPLPR